MRFPRVKEKEDAGKRPEKGKGAMRLTTNWGEENKESGEEEELRGVKFLESK